VRRAWNEYRLGAEVNWAGFRFTIQRRWDFYKEDPSYSAQTSTVQRSEPYHGSDPGWLGNLVTQRKWGAINARMTYAIGRRDFALVESASGVQPGLGAVNRQIFVNGSAQRPLTAGDFSFSLFPTSRLTIVNNTAVHSTRIDGDSSYNQFDNGTGLGASLNFRYLGVRTIANSTDLNYRATNWFGFYGGYHYSDRLIRFLEAYDLPTAPATYDQTNILRAGSAGVRFRPAKPFTVNLEGEIGRASRPLTPVSESHYHTLGGRADYRARNVQLSAQYRQTYNLNAPLSFTAFSSHARSAGASASWSPRGWFSLDAGYTKLHLDTASGLAFFAGTGMSQLQQGYLSLYRSNIHAANLMARFALGRRADFYAGYTITRDTGGARTPAGTDPIQILLSSVQTFPLSYQSPLARVSIRLTPKLRWNAGWQFYDYAEDFHLLSYMQNYRAHTGYSSVSWSF
ncbi:MAG: hypothetical protein LAQ30_30765, partial [Acidobacteriia bacterium]|nr:hypothetical protein [Terriglobia bacterium]